MTSPTAWERIERKYDPEENKVVLNVVMLGHVGCGYTMTEFSRGKLVILVIKGFSDN